MTLFPVRSHDYPRRGRGATPQITGELAGGGVLKRLHDPLDWLGWREQVGAVVLPRMARRSASGRASLSLRFRPLQRWLPAKAITALRVIGYYWGRVGGFAQVDDGLLRAVIDESLNYTPRELRWAIDAKADSLTGRSPEEAWDKRRRFVPRPDRFFAEGVHLWLERSPEYQRASQQRRAAVQSRLAQRIVAYTLTADGRLVEETALDLSAWNDLPMADRRAAEIATRAEYERICDRASAAPNDPTMQPTRVQLALIWIMSRGGKSC